MNQIVWREEWNFFRKEIQEDKPCLGTKGNARIMSYQIENVSEKTEITNKN